MRTATDEKAVASWFQVFGLHDPERPDGMFGWKGGSAAGSRVESLSCLTCGVQLLDVATFESHGGRVTFAVLDSLLRLHYVLAFEVEARAGE